MKREDVDKREKALCDLLKSLSSPNLDVNNDESYRLIITSLHAVYDLDDERDHVYRHSYSQIFILLSKIHTEQTLQNSLDSLIQNLRFVYYKVQKDPKENSKFRQAIYKLYDHVNLDTARINFLNNENKEYYSRFLKDYEKISQEYIDLKRYHEDLIDNYNSILHEYTKLKGDFSELEQQVKVANKEYQQTSSKLEKYQERAKIDLVAILGVFAAIIIGFVAPMAFSSQLMANLKDTTAGKIMIASAVCGIVTIVVFYMIYLILERIVFNAQSEKLLFGKWGVALVLFLLSVILIAGLCRSDNQQQPVPSKNPENSVTIHQLINTTDMPQDRR